VALGLFDYDRRGILDAGHVRFFTRSSFERLVGRVGLSVRRCEAVGPPPEIVRRGSRGGANGNDSGGGLLARLNRLSCQLWPNLFAYQFLFELEHAPRPPTG
jgi:hypothetical protein